MPSTVNKKFIYLWSLVLTVAFTIVIYPLFNFAMIDSTKALQDQALAVDGPKGDQVDSIELKRLKDDMTSMKKKIMGKSVYFWI